MNSQFSWQAMLAFLIANLLVPWLENKGVLLDVKSNIALQAVAVTAVGAALHALHIGGQVAVKKLLAPKAPPAAVWSLLLLPLGLLLGGCATLNTPSAEQMLIMDSIELGTSAVLDSRPALERTIDANAIVTAAKAAEAVATGDQTTLAQLQTVVATALAAAKLNPLQQQLLAAVVGNAVQLISGKLTSGVLDPTTQTSVANVLNWIIAGATPYTTVSAQARFAVRARAQR